MRSLLLCGLISFATVYSCLGQNGSVNTAPNNPYNAAQNQEATKVIDGAYAKLDIKGKRALPYEPIREADVFWQKRIWREIDFREKMNLPFAYPQEPFVGILMEAVNRGELQAYSPLEDDFSIPLPREDLKGKLWTNDTIPLFDLQTGAYIADTVVRNEPDFTTYQKIMIKEDWIFDEESSTMVCRIIGIAPMRPVVDPTTGFYLGDEILCWIHYPTARDLLVQYEAYNPWNDGVRHSWNDILDMRYFSSYVVKESNVYDRRIDSYASGIDAALEGERVKKDVFTFEHELWEY